VLLIATRVLRHYTSSHRLPTKERHRRTPGPGVRKGVCWFSPGHQNPEGGPTSHAIAPNFWRGSGRALLTTVPTTVPTIRISGTTLLTLRFGTRLFHGITSWRTLRGVDTRSSSTLATRRVEARRSASDGLSKDDKFSGTKRLQVRPTKKLVGSRPVPLQ
jgi:hypothetical protein